MSDGRRRPSPSPSLEELIPLLRQMQLVMLKHPAAAQAAFRALVHEGRRFATTPEGQEWKSRIARSDLVLQGREVWEGVTLNMFEADGDQVLPSNLLDAFVAAAGFESLEKVFAMLYLGSRPGDDHGRAP